MVIVLSHLLLASTTVFVSPQRASSMIADAPELVVLDARTSAQQKEFLPGTQSLDWRDYLGSWAPKAFNLWAVSRNAKLSEDRVFVARKLAPYGLSLESSVIIYGDGVKGWGEEGRVWWMLRYLGLDKVYILDGGIEAWKKAKLQTHSKAARKTSKSTFVIKPRESLKVDADGVHASISRSDSVIIDTRSLAEYQGATPHYSARGGHIPSAKHLYWKSLFTSEGKVLDQGVITQKMATLGVTGSSSIIAYCTGGVRSAMVQAVLLHSGFEKVANYDGSWWDWSKQKKRPIEK